MNLMSSTLMLEDTGIPFDERQADQIAAFHDSWAAAAWEHSPRVSKTAAADVVAATPR
jgi:hypothetical protein